MNSTECLYTVVRRSVKVHGVGVLYCPEMSQQHSVSHLCCETFSDNPPKNKKQ